MASIRKRAWACGGESRTAWVVDYFDQGGKRRLKTFAKKGDARDWAVTALHEVRERKHVPESTAPTLAEAAEAWISRGQADGRERSTLDQRRQHIEFHIKPLLGAETKLPRLDLDAFRDELLRTRSRALAKKVMTSVKAILKQAKMPHLLADVAKIETGGRHKRRLEIGCDIPAPAEVRILLAAATGYTRALLAVAVFCGLRASELRALTWADLDLAERRLQVRQRADKWSTVGLLKSDKSYRSIPLAPFATNVLKEWRLARPGDGLVFGNGAGNVESLANIWNRCLAPLQVAAGIARPKLDPLGAPAVADDGAPVLKAKYGLHAFRHFFASWLIDQGFGPKRVQLLMGHSGIQITFDTYGHLFPQEDDHQRFATGELTLVG
jgi:integrase